MRLSKPVSFGDGVTAVVHEINLKVMRIGLSGLVGLKDMSIDQMLGERFDEVAKLAEMIIELPNGMTFDDLSISEIDLLIEAARELNPNFFSTMSKMLGAASPAKQPQQSMTLTDAVQD